MVLLCGHHHRVIHHDGWDVKIDPDDRLPTFTPPRWVDPGERPRRNNRPRLSEMGKSLGGAKARGEADIAHGSGGRTEGIARPVAPP
jgi:hypothetical protein